MLKKIPLLTLAGLLMVITSSRAQIAEDLMVGGHFDLVKTDYVNLLQKVQIGAEVNYFATRTITVTSGLEYWSTEGMSFLVGGRWYPKENAFVRLRGLVGANDLSIGAGWSKPMNENIRFEAIGDIYFKFDFAIRIGIVYIRRKKA
jgi:hypothetical protein